MLLWVVIIKLQYCVKPNTYIFPSSLKPVLICKIIFNEICNIYISRLCYDASVRLSVRLFVTFVHCGHRVQWILDICACLDRWMSLLLTDSASPGSSDEMMPGFSVEEGV